MATINITFECKVFAMRKLLLFAITIVFIVESSAQTPINFGQSTLINGDSQYGFNRPRVVVIDNGEPFVIWGRSGGNSATFCSKLIAGSFSAPVQLSPDSMQVRSGWYDGPNAASKGDTIYVVWHNISTGYEHVYLVRSFDGGSTFSDPIQTDTITGNSHIEYPGVAVDANGNPVIFFIKSNSDWSMPRQVIYASTSFGDTFSTEIEASEFSPGIPCECCQGFMDITDDNWVFMYRNNVSDIRNTYFAVSDNVGTSFESSYELDSQDWLIQSCPSSGPEGYVSGDNIIGTWMSAGYVNNSKIVFGSININNPVENGGELLEPSLAEGVTQNYPAITGSGEHGAIVWQDNRYGLNQVFISVTDDTGQSYGPSYLISDTTLIGSSDAAHIAFADGVFHIVWKTLNGTYYTSASITTAIKEPNLLRGVVAYPNPSNGLVTIDYCFLNETPKMLVIYDVLGNLALEETLTGVMGSKLIPLDHMATGMYNYIVYDQRQVIFKGKFVTQ